MQHLGPLIFGSNGDVVQFLKDKCLLSFDCHCPRCFEEMRIDQFTFVLFVCIYQCECRSWGADSSIGQKSSCEEYAPHTAKCILGAYSSQYPYHQYNTRSRLMFQLPPCNTNWGKNRSSYHFLNDFINLSFSIDANTTFSNFKYQLWNSLL